MCIIKVVKTKYKTEEASCPYQA